MKRAVVLGLARSGVGAANLLARKGYSVVVTDKKPRAELEVFIKQLEPAVELSLGGHPAGLTRGAELVVMSPGVPMSAPPVCEALAAGVEVIGELELAYRVLSHKPFYAVTGTNGKSTTVTLLHEMMLASGKRSVLAGNIGNSLCAEVASGTASSSEVDALVVEVSSFQLEGVSTFRPRAATVLNLTPDHLDRYGSMEEYMTAKLMVSVNMREGDSLVLNADDPVLAGAQQLLGRVARAGLLPEGLYYFSRKQKVRGVYMSGDAIHYDLGREAGKGELIKAGEVRIKGVHNIENAMAASALALLAGCPVEAIRKTLRDFPGLEHRLEPVRTFEGITYINDSKGTNVGAVEKSLASFESPVVLIAGGRDKAGEFGLLVPLLKKYARAVVLIGEAADKMQAAFEGTVPLIRAADMRDAVARARAAAKAGDVVLLSPACASFDMFRDFEDRGRKFKEAVKAL